MYILHFLEGFLQPYNLVIDISEPCHAFIVRVQLFLINVGSGSQRCNYSNSHHDWGETEMFSEI